MMRRQAQLRSLVGAYMTIVVLMLINSTKVEFTFEKILSASSRTEQTGRIHIVSNYPLIYESPWREKQTSINVSLLRERQLEIEEVLQKNLDIPLVEKVHLLVDQESAEKRLRGLPLGANKHKLVVKHIDAMPKWRHFLSYVSDNLLNRVVAMLNMDVYFGEGIEKINKTFLVQQNVFYALSRTGRKEKRCDMSGWRGYCGLGYVGSHDGYVSVFTKPIPEPVLNELDFGLERYGSENVLIWVAHNRLAKKLLNPCHDLKLFHVHCIQIHAGTRTRINYKLKKDGKIKETGLYS